MLDLIEERETDGLDNFTRGYEKYGIHANPDGSVVIKEWCPGAKELYLWGEFSACKYYSNYNKTSTIDK